MTGKKQKMDNPRAGRSHQDAVILLLLAQETGDGCELTSEQAAGLLVWQTDALARLHSCLQHGAELQEEIVRLKKIERFVNIEIDEGDSPEYMIQDEEYKWVLEALDYE